MTQYYVDGAAGSDSNAGTSAGAGNAWATLGKAASTATALKDVVNVKASATYTLTARVDWSSAGINIIGYTTTPGADDGRPLITSSTTTVNLFNANADGLKFRHLKFTHTGATRGSAFIASSAERGGIVLDDIIVDGCLHGIEGDFGSFFGFSGISLRNCVIKNCTGYGAACPVIMCHGSYFLNNTGDGWQDGPVSITTGLAVFNRCVFSGNQIGVDWFTNRTGSLFLVDTVVRSSVGDNIYMGSGNGFNRGFFSENLVTELAGTGGTGYGIHSGVSSVMCRMFNTAFRSNQTGDRDGSLPAGTNDITLTADPWTNAAGDNYSPNATAGGGLLLKGLSAVYGFGTSYADGGAVQSQAAAAGGLLTHPGMEGGMRG